jgi:cob(I)alamin adenosyltransferase
VNGDDACFPGEGFIISPLHSSGILVMANRLSKIVTRTGDHGTTGMADGSRLPKHAPRVEALGDVDELNSQLGVLLAEVLPAEVRACLLEVQHDLFDLGGEIATPGFTLITEAHVARLDDALEIFNRDLPPLREFVLPGGSRPASLAHVARSVCRRAERRVVALAAQESLSALIQCYLNRLSDLLFVLARIINRGLEVPDVLWQRGDHRGGDGA